MTTAEFIRRAAEGYRPAEDDKATENTAKAIDDALEFVAASNKRIAKLEAGGKAT